MSGGQRTLVSFVTEDDYERAVAGLRKQLDMELAKELEEEGRYTKLRVFPSTVRWGELTVDPERELIGEPGPSFRVAMHSMATVTAVDENEVAAFAAARLAKRVSSGYELIPGSMNVRMSDPVVDVDAVSYEVDALGEQRLVDVDAPGERSAVVWLAALSLLATILLVAAIVLVVR